MVTKPLTRSGRRSAIDSDQLPENTATNPEAQVKPGGREKRGVKRKSTSATSEFCLNLRTFINVWG